MTKENLTTLDSLPSLPISLYPSSLQEEGPQVPQQETLQQIAARIIQKAWKRHVVGAAAVGTPTLAHVRMKVNRHKLNINSFSYTNCSTERSSSISVSLSAIATIRIHGRSSELSILER